MGRVAHVNLPMHNVRCMHTITVHALVKNDQVRQSPRQYCFIRHKLARQKRDKVRSTLHTAELKRLVCTIHHSTQQTKTKVGNYATK